MGPRLLDFAPDSGLSLEIHWGFSLFPASPVLVNNWMWSFCIRSKPHHGCDLFASLISYSWMWSFCIRSKRKAWMWSFFILIPSTNPLKWKCLGKNLLESTNLAQNQKEGQEQKSCPIVTTFFIIMCMANIIFRKNGVHIEETFFAENCCYIYPTLSVQIGSEFKHLWIRLNLIMNGHQPV